MIRRTEWCREAEERLFCALGDDLPRIRDQVYDKKAALYEMIDDQSDGLFVVRLETFKCGSSELVAVAVAGRGLVAGSKKIIDRVRDHVDSIRIHTKRAGIARWCESMGFKFCEVVNGYQVYRFYCGR